MFSGAITCSPHGNLTDIRGGEKLALVDEDLRASRVQGWARGTRESPGTKKECGEVIFRPAVV